MPGKTSIEWTERTWNPTTGCDQVSPGCDHCYALTMAARLKAAGAAAYQRDGNPITSGPGFGLTLHPDRLEQPIRWQKPSLIFVNSMSDLFHDQVPLAFIRQVFEVMAATPRHTYQVLTKRSTRLLRVAGELPWPANVWMGVSVEDQRRLYRAERLARVPAAVRFLSVEPMLGRVNILRVLYPFWAVSVEDRRPGDRLFGQNGVDWVIAGGESGPGARPCELDWLRSLRDQCKAAGVAFFLKQLGTVLARGAGLRGKGGHGDALLDGRRWVEMPA